MAWTVTRDGQKRWSGKTREDHMRDAAKLEREASRENVAEVVYRLRDQAAFLRHNAARMAHSEDRFG